MRSKRSAENKAAANCFAGSRPRLLGSAAAAAAWLLTALLMVSGGVGAQTGNAQASVNASSQGAQAVELIDSYPYYMQSPLVSSVDEQLDSQLGKQQRSSIPSGPDVASGAGGAAARLAAPIVVSQLQPQPQPPQLLQQQQQQQQLQSRAPECLYDKKYFLGLDQCLERKPQPSIGLPAFKNEDLLIKKGLSDKYGCSFILTNGLFKNHAIHKFSLDSDTQCLEQDKTSQLTIQFANVTLYYLWQLRCLNYADQLMDDATFGGRTLLPASDLSGAGSGGGASSSTAQGARGAPSAGICVGSSQNFGFASLQLASIEVLVELQIDIYKNWRVTNVTLAMAPGGGHAHPGPKSQKEHSEPQSQHTGGGGGGGGTNADRSSAIRDFTFETLDGDELNWRYLHLYENWTRNRLHVNFLDQFKRFIWVSMQRCLSESSEKLPVRLNDIFGHHKFN